MQRILKSLIIFSIISLISCQLFIDDKSIDKKSINENEILEQGSKDIQKIYYDKQNYFFHVKDTSLYNLNIDLKESKKNVYLVFTNPQSYNLKLPLITNLSTVPGSKSDSYLSPEDIRKSGFSINLDLHNSAGWSEGTPLYEAATTQKIKPKKNNSSSTRDYVGKKSEFSGDYTYDKNNKIIYEKLPATCHLTRTVETEFGPKTLNIWVADNCYKDGGIKDYLINDKMIKEMADHFLISGKNNDIYDWVTNILGEEWSDISRVYASAIPDINEITIFLLDLKEDNGFYSKKDNFRKKINTSYYKQSNERIMFYVNAVDYAEYSGLTPDSWKITEPEPSSMLSTVAHELNHVIYYHQKLLYQNKYSSDIFYPDRWLNEMSAMCIQDLLADKIKNDRPRNVKYNDYTAGKNKNYKGRLPMYIYHNDIRTINNESKKYKIIDYANSYAFGAYLMRNFGGAQFIKDLIQNPYTDEHAVTYALKKSGSSCTFKDSLMKWGTAVVLSDIAHKLNEYKYNIKNTSTCNNVTYNLGAINLYNYEFWSNGSHKNQVGPFFYNSKLYYENVDSYLNPTSNFYFELGKELTGEINYLINMAPETRLTVIIK